MKSALHSTTRRTFLRQTAVAGAALGFPAVLRAASPNSRINVAVVGVDGQGYSDLHNVSTHARANFVGFCDVDLNRFARADALVAGVPHFQDFRAMFDQLGDTLDAVIVAIPDHMHALGGIEAMKRGKHVYGQKPLAKTVWESRQMRLWAEKKGVVTQMGNHIHSAVEYRMATRLLREGVIGKVKEVFSWVAVSGNERTRLLEPPAPGTVPAGLDWERWIGGAPMRPYSPIVYHPFAWRDWQDFGGGAIGDFACHILDPVFTALDIRAPLTIGADNSGINRHIWPTAEVVKYVFPGTAFTAGPKLNVTWSDGGLRPDRKLAQLPADLDLPRSGSLFIGEKGNLVLPHVGGPRLYPVDNFSGFAYPKDIKGLNHYHRWLDAIVDGTKTTDGFDYAGWLSEAAQLGNVATRFPRRPAKPTGKLSVESGEMNLLEWDHENLRITNNVEANALLTRVYRPGWEVSPA
ncbi:MAG: Gfo/Idh/MocA family oxidoreductase [Opitutus sp.]|nr:Gfo/Idh/MocA family oxidoreductase [Opitutus sp.]